MTNLQVEQEGSAVENTQAYNDTSGFVNQPKVAENEEGCILRYYNMSQENVRVSERTTNGCRSSGTTVSSSYRLIGTAREKSDRMD